MLRRPTFWILFALAAATCTLFSIRYFPAAYPVVALELQMDRQAALRAADAVAARHGFGPRGWRQTASFGLDRQAQMYVELEAGGSEAFAELLSGGRYSPYTWRVRHFRPGETEETRFRFTPAGEPYGFVQTLPEDLPGPGLEGEAARRLAEGRAADWDVELRELTLVEQSKEERTGGRIDHTLVYERTRPSLGEARYRLRLVVSGDRLTELSHTLKVPEAFSRRFEEMRTANDVISSSSLLAAAVLYLVVGCVGGLFWLLRRRWVVWRQPLGWGFSIALLQLLAHFNLWPLLWMEYDTALSEHTFVLQQLVIQLIRFVGQGLLLSLSLMGAESLTRRAFPHHVQLWKAWTPRAAGSLPVLGQTAAAYLLVALLFAYDIALYLFSNRALGWWSPSSPLFDPDLLAGYFPWLNSIAISLQAGFWEECLFRAVPIAGAALLGQRFGHRRAWIVAALVVQALVFGAGHANYPTMPAYARLVELLLPSVLFGIIYLRLGLLPAIVLHYAFDVVWTALPILVASAPGGWLDQAFVVGLAFVPLFMVVRGRLRLGAWQPEAEGMRNREWHPAQPRPPAAIARERRLRQLPEAAGRGLVAAGALGLVAWGACARFSADAPALEPSRSQAVATARGALAARGIELDDSWRVLPSVIEPLDEQHRFVWHTGGRESYRQLLGTYLAPPLWRVRFARFEGDLAERAEEVQVFVAGGEGPPRIRHRLPESRAGASLEENEARGLALRAVKRELRLAEYEVREVSAVAAKRPERTDWELTFAHDQVYPLDQGEARIVVDVAGDEVVDLRRGVHVPELWEREARERRTTETTTALLGAGLVGLLLVAGTLTAPAARVGRPFPMRFVTITFFGLALLQLVDLASSWPTAMAGLSTARPIVPQLLLGVGFGSLFALLWAGALALLLAMLQVSHPPQSGDGTPRWAGLALGSFAAGVLALAARSASPAAPVWGSYAAAGDYLPVLGVVTGWLDAFIVRTALVLLIFITADRFSDGWNRRRPLGGCGLLLAGAGLAATVEAGGLLAVGTTAVVMSLLFLASYVGVLRFGIAPVPVAVAVVTGLGALRAAWLEPHPGAVAGGLLATASIAALAVFWERDLRALH